MCLQWCHVRSLLIDNDLPCKPLCPDNIRLARISQHCRDCRHHHPGHPGLCLLTHEIPPLAETCCHWNAEIEHGLVLLRLGKTVPQELVEAHGVESTRQLFEMIESAPELDETLPSEGIPIEIEDLAVPLVYGLPAADWQAALYPPNP